MLIGGDNLILDSKYRLSMPAKHRSYIDACCQGRFVIAPSEPVTLEDGRSYLERSIWLYPLDAWEKIYQQIMQLPLNSLMTRQKQRMLLNRAVSLNLDSASRLVIPQALREYAGIDKEVHLTAMGSHFEIWDRQIWERDNQMQYEFGVPFMLGGAEPAQVEGGQ